MLMRPSPSAETSRPLLPSLRFFTRAGDRTRTGDVQLGKLAFYQLNYAREKPTAEPSNARRTACQISPADGPNERAAQRFRWERRTPAKPAEATDRASAFPPENARRHAQLVAPLQNTRLRARGIATIATKQYAEHRRSA